VSPQTTRRHQTPVVRPSTGKPDGRMGGPVPHSQHPAGWYRTMDRGFAVDHYGFPALPRRGERHTATDGSVWEFDLTGTDWWELAEYAPGETDRSIAAEALADALKREGDRESSIGFYRDRYWLPIARRLIAEGWRPPAQVITDPAAADQLPAGALVITDAGVVAQRYDGMGGWWQVLDGDPIGNSAELIGTGSIEVLRIPTENGDTE
jgi:hypothetical protein